MKFSLRSLIIFTTVLGTLLAVATVSRRHAREVERHSKEFYALYDRCDSFETEIVNALRELKPVQDAVETRKKRRKQLLPSVTYCAAIAEAKEAFTIRLFTFGNRQMVRLKSMLLRIKSADGTYLPIVDVNLSAQLNTAEMDHHVVTFTYPDTKTNESIAKLFFEHLGEEFNLRPVTRKIPNSSR